MRKSRYSDYEVADGDATQALIDAPEPAKKVPSEPLFPMGGTPYTPTSKCAHWCKRCSGSGVIGIDEKDVPIECPVCFDEETKRGTGQSWPDPPFYCPICHRSGMDGRKATPHEVEPLPAGDGDGFETVFSAIEQGQAAVLGTSRKEYYRSLAGLSSGA